MWLIVPANCDAAANRDPILDMPQAWGGLSTLGGILLSHFLSVHTNTLPLQSGGCSQQIHSVSSGLGEIHSDARHGSYLAGFTPFI
jgi:hypothetical protein